MDLFKKRFAELTEQAETLDAGKKLMVNPATGERQTNIEWNALLNWKVKAKSLLEKVCGKKSQHMTAFTDAEDHPFSTALSTLHRCQQVFAAAKEDYEGGYLTSVRSLVQAEVFDSELEQAKELLLSKYASPAAVVAGTVLETTLRSLCTKHGIAHASLDRMNADLTKASVYNGVMQKRITHLAAVRNSAAHGNKEEFETYDVAAMIDEVERFVATHIV